MSGTENWFSEDSASSSASIPITIPGFFIKCITSPGKTQLSTLRKAYIFGVMGRVQKEDFSR
ncbi:MAG: hypothetical protein IKD62_00375, partial [Oscillospiraceae bacterium]|nr:hypothetical protein [Oscillospiraceae bacterium]